MTVQEALAGVRELVPELKVAALVLVPDGFVLGHVGEGGILEHETLARVATGLFAGVEAPEPDGAADRVTEYFILLADRVMVLQRGRRQPGMVLCTMTSREPNLGLLLTTARDAIAWVESHVDPAVLDG